MIKTGLNHPVLLLTTPNNLGTTTLYSPVMLQAYWLCRRPSSRLLDSCQQNRAANLKSGVLSCFLLCNASRTITLFHYFSISYKNCRNVVACPNENIACYFGARKIHGFGNTDTGQNPVIDHNSIDQKSVRNTIIHNSLSWYLRKT